MGGGKTPSSASFPTSAAGKDLLGFDEKIFGRGGAIDGQLAVIVFARGRRSPTGDAGGVILLELVEGTSSWSLLSRLPSPGTYC